MVYRKGCVLLFISEYCLGNRILFLSIGYGRIPYIPPLVTLYPVVWWAIG